MKIFIISLICYPVFLFGQSRYLRSFPVFGVSLQDNLMYFHEYTENFKILQRCNSYDDCKNNHPEQTLMSILSATNYNWDKQNYAYEIKDRVDKYKRIKNDENYFKLLFKVTFKTNDSEYSIIKYHIRDMDKWFPAANVLSKINGKWYVIKPTGSLSKAYLMFNYLSVDSLSAIFNNEKIRIESFDKQISKIYNKGVLDFSAAINSTSNSEMTDQDLKFILDPLLIQ